MLHVPIQLSYHTHTSIPGMLGYHGESSYLYSDGKSISVTVELNCEEGFTDPCCDCGQFKRCEECQASTKPDCVWNVDRKACVVRRDKDTKGNVQ